MEAETSRSPYFSVSVFNVGRGPQLTLCFGSDPSDETSQDVSGTDFFELGVRLVQQILNTLRPAHRMGDLLAKIFFDLTRLVRSGMGIRNHGNLDGQEFKILEKALKFIPGWFHIPGMKGGTYLQGDEHPGAGLFKHTTHGLDILLKT